MSYPASQYDFSTPSIPGDKLAEALGDLQKQGYSIRQVFQERRDGVDGYRIFAVREQNGDTQVVQDRLDRGLSVERIVDETGIPAAQVKRIRARAQRGAK